MFIELTRKGYIYSNKTITYSKFTININTIAGLESTTFFDTASTYVVRTHEHLDNENVTETPEEIRELIRKEMNKQTSIISPSMWTGEFSVVDSITTYGEGEVKNGK